MFKNLFFLSTILLAANPCNFSYASYLMQEEMVDEPGFSSEFTSLEHFKKAQLAMREENWREAARQFNIVIYYFPDSPYAQEASYYLGVSAYQLGEYDSANIAFNRYLQSRNNPQFFEEAVKYKFSIAEQFRSGARRRPFGTKKLPKWLSANEEAIAIYDEVIAAMPSHELAVQSLYLKGCLLWKMRDYTDAIETYQTLIRRFPKHELTPQAYLNITKVLLDQSRFEFQNPDLLALAEVNVKKFAKEFPREELIEEARNDVHKIKEVYARGLFETASFYERINKSKAAVIYYEKAIMQFPETQIAQCCRNCLKRISPKAISIIEQALEWQVNLREKAAESPGIEFDPSKFNIEEFSFD